MGVITKQRKIMNAVANTMVAINALILGLIPTAIITKFINPEQLENHHTSFWEFVFSLDFWQFVSTAFFAIIFYLFITEKFSSK